MSTSSTLTSVLSALGGTTGIDVTSAVDAILYADRAPERGWQAQQTTLENQTSAINQLETEASSLSDSLTTLQDTAGVLSSVSATSSNTSLLTATAADGTIASNHSITIQSLATSGAFYSDSVASSSTGLSQGSFDLTVGSGSATTIQVTSGETLTQLAAAINSQSLVSQETSSPIVTAHGWRSPPPVQVQPAILTVTNDNCVAFTRSSTGENASLTHSPWTESSNHQLVQHCDRRNRRCHPQSAWRFPQSNLMDDLIRDYRRNTYQSDTFSRHQFDHASRYHICNRL